MIVTAIYARDPGPQPQWSKLEDALSRGYNPTADDPLPPAQHLNFAPDDAWAIALAASVEEARHFSCAHSQPDQDKDTH